jgi:hypothetical protein
MESSLLGTHKMLLYCEGAMIRCRQVPALVYSLQLHLLNFSATHGHASLAMSYWYVAWANESAPEQLLLWNPSLDLNCDTAIAGLVANQSLARAAPSKSRRI